MASLTKEKILIIGGSGSLGHQLTETLIQDNEIYIYARNELKIWEMRKEFPKAHFIVGDIRNTRVLSDTVLSIKPNIIIIALALKHVDVCEKFISQSVEINYQGIDSLLNMIYTWYEQGVNMSWLNSVVYTSTDKAVEPITVYGMCKAITERNMYSIAEKLKDSHIRFITTRYGNVFTSNGSLYHVFEEIANNPEKKAFTVTHRDMTRFYMSLQQSVELILNAISWGKTGDIWIPRLNSFRVMDLAMYYSEKYKKPIEIIGLRGIEKIHEKLVSVHEEVQTCISTFTGDDIVIIPRFRQDLSNRDDKHPTDYSSENTLKSYDFEKLTR